MIPPTLVSHRLLDKMIPPNFVSQRLLDKIIPPTLVSQRLLDKMVPPTLVSQNTKKIMHTLLHDLLATILTILDLLGRFKSGNSPGVDGKARNRDVADSI